MLWWLAWCIVGGTLVTLILVSISRSTSGQPPRVRMTGRVLERPEEPPDAIVHLVGGCQVSGALGLVAATWPLALLEVRHGSVSMRIRPNVLAATLATAPLSATPGDGTHIFPARSWLGRTALGLTQGARQGYFWTVRPATLLGAIERAGFDVSWEERKANFL